MLDSDDEQKLEESAPDNTLEAPPPSPQAVDLLKIGEMREEMRKAEEEQEMLEESFREFWRREMDVQPIVSDMPAEDAAESKPAEEQKPEDAFEIVVEKVDKPEERTTILDKVSSFFARLVDSDALSTLKEMGFENEAENRKALMQSFNNVSKAVAVLISKQ